MNLKQIADLIPAEYRKEMLDTNMISGAVASSADPSMYYLFVIWKNYVEPSVPLDINCTLCLTRILTNLQQMQEVFVGLERESQLLKSL